MRKIDPDLSRLIHSALANLGQLRLNFADDQEAAWSALERLGNDLFDLEHHVGVHTPLALFDA